MRDIYLNSSGLRYYLDLVNPTNLMPTSFVIWFQKNSPIPIGKLKLVDAKIAAICAVVFTCFVVVGFALRSYQFRGSGAPSHTNKVLASNTTSNEYTSEQSVKREPFDMDVFKQVVTDEDVYRNSYCFATAWNVVKYITGETPRGFQGLMGTCFPSNKFLDKDESGQYTHQYAKDLFDITSEKSSVFDFSLPKELHAFVIHKKADRGVVKYTVFQSCLGLYNLKNWLGVVESKNSDFKEWDSYKTFGNGNEVTAEQIYEFMESIIENYGDQGYQEIRMNKYDL